jgi:preprotein translocase subunit Sss1
VATHDDDEMSNGLQTLLEDGERVFSRARRPTDRGHETLLIVKLVSMENWP